MNQQYGKKKARTDKEGADKKRTIWAGLRGWVKAVIVTGVLTLAAALAAGLLLISRTSDIPITQELLDELPLDQISRLMIVAHPDDETFWGGAHLAQEHYLVVCLTCGKDPVRKSEFEMAVRFTGSIPLILDYPDKEVGIRSRWLGYMDDIQRDLTALLNYRDWEVVVTHNPFGEYGHIHHRRISSMLTAALESHPQTQLYYFGVYHNVRELEKMQMEDMLPQQVSEDLYALKEQMTVLYPSQGRIANEFCHMFPYEDWYPAK